MNIKVANKLDENEFFEIYGIIMKKIPEMEPGEVKQERDVFLHSTEVIDAWRNNL